LVARTGGLLFVFEDVASFWTPTLGWQVFVACMTSGAIPPARWDALS
jgi:hypothetical protein